MSSIIQRTILRSNLNEINYTEVEVYQLHRSGGLLFVNYYLHVIRHFEVDVKTEITSLLLSPRQDPSLRLCVMLYHNVNPKNTRTTANFLKDIEIMISHVPHWLPTFIVGDFNIDMSLRTQSSKQLHNLIMRHYGFHPTVKEATHRQGGHLDNTFMNISSNPLLDVVPKYHTGHMYIALAVPWIHLY